MIGATGVFDLGHEAQPGRFEGGPVGAKDGPAAGLHLVEALELGVVGGELGVGARCCRWRARRWSSVLSVASSALELGVVGVGARRWSSVLSGLELGVVGVGARRCRGWSSALSVALELGVVGVVGGVGARGCRGCRWRWSSGLSVAMAPPGDDGVESLVQRRGQGGGDDVTSPPRSPWIVVGGGTGVGGDEGEGDEDAAAEGDEADQAEQENRLTGTASDGTLGLLGNRPAGAGAHALAIPPRS